MSLISKKIADSINQQIGMEFGASIQYDAIAAYFDTEALPNLARHFYQQANEERMHAHKFMKFVIDAGATVAIPAILAPKSRFKWAGDAVKLAYDNEILVTNSINAIAVLASKEANFTTLNFLQWFIEEQVEEVSSADQLVKIVERAGEGGVLFVDDYLARAKGGEGKK